MLIDFDTTILTL
jgi:hypothetical protein